VIQIHYVEAGCLYDGTDPTYGDNQYTTVYECGRCGALVTIWRQEDHTAHHEKNDRKDES
jgi:hypothetical protein